MAWKTAYLSRVEEFPSLESQLIDEEEEAETREQTPEEMIAMARLWNAALGGDVTEV